MLKFITVGFVGFSIRFAVPDPIYMAGWLLPTAYCAPFDDQRDRRRESSPGSVPPMYLATCWRFRVSYLTDRRRATCGILSAAKYVVIRRRERYRKLQIHSEQIKRTYISACCPGCYCGRPPLDKRPIRHFAIVTAAVRSNLFTCSTCHRLLGGAD